MSLRYEPSSELQQKTRRSKGRRGLHLQLRVEKAWHRPPFCPRFLISECREDDRKRETAEKGEGCGSQSVAEKPPRTQLRVVDVGSEGSTGESKYVAEKLGSNQLRLSSGVDSALGMEVNALFRSFGGWLVPA